MDLCTCEEKRALNQHACVFLKQQQQQQQSGSSSSSSRPMPQLKQACNTVAAPAPSCADANIIPPPIKPMNSQGCCIPTLSDCSPVCGHE